MANDDGTTLEVTVYESVGDEDPQVFEGIDYVSLVSGGTYGPPALVAPNKGQAPTASVDDQVLYVNTSFVPMFEIVRKRS